MRTCQHTFIDAGTNDNCWYCGKDDGEFAYFSLEWDTVVHVCCVIKAHNDKPDDLEADIFNNELPYLIDRDDLQEYGYKP